MTTSTKPAVWIGCLECHNNGQLVGEWYPAVIADTVTSSDVHRRSIRPGTHEELWVIDHEGIPVRGEMDPVTAAEWGRVLEEVGDDDRAALCAWVESGDDTAEGDGEIPALDEFRDAYLGEWASFREYAESYATGVDLLDAVPDHVARYFNWDAWARDLELDYTVCDAPGGAVFVFRSL